MPASMQLNPSLLGKFFSLDCERMLRYSSTPEERRKQEGVPDPVPLQNPLAEAVIETGRAWEEKVVREILKDRVLVGPEKEDKRLYSRILPYKKTVSTLRKPKSGLYLYQSQLNPPIQFYNRYGFQESEIHLNPCRPDLIAIVENSKDDYFLQVTDIKASHATKFSHCVQATLYTLILRDILEQEKIHQCKIDMENCSIWLFEQDQPEKFSISHLLPPFENFLRNKLPKILLQPASAAPWGLKPKCEWCEYYGHCREEAEETKDVSLLAHFPCKARAFLNNLDIKATSLDAFESFLENKEKDKLRNCPFLSEHKQELQAQLQSFKQKDAILYSNPCLSLPKGQHIGIVLTLQEDPLTGQIFAAGIHVHGGKEIHGQSSPWTIVSENDTEEAGNHVIYQFFARLEEIMRSVHKHNLEQKDFMQKKTLQCYTYYSFERDLLDKIWLKALEESEKARQFLSLFFYFQSRNPEDSHRAKGSEIPLPIIVVNDVLKSSVALPIPVSYRLKDASILLKPDKFASIYNENPKLCLPLSNQLRADSMNQAWKEGDKEKIQEAIEEVKIDLEKRMKATFSVLAGLREKLGDRLHLYPPKFFLPEGGEPQDSMFSRLYFITQYEEALEYLEVHSAHTLPLARRLESGNAIALELEQETKKNVWQAFLLPESEHITPESGYNDWILTEKNEEGEEIQRNFPDFWYRRQSWPPSRHRLAFASIEKATVLGKKKQIFIKIHTSTGSPELQGQKRYVLHKRYTDFTSERILNFLSQLDENKEYFCAEFLRDTHACLEKRTRPKSLKTEAKLHSFLEPFGFTASQKKAFQRILDSNFQLIWGPPGTGKTHFLALTVLALTAIAEQEGKKLKVLVSAFTHAAIENCLSSINKLRQNYENLIPSLEITKIGEWKGQTLPAHVAEQKNWYRSENTHHIAGATVFAIANPGIMEDGEKFDVVILDEGSQMKIAQACIPLSHLDFAKGRFILAGDDCQLGPISKVQSSETMDSRLFHSVFSYLKEADPEQKYTSQLLECFRMNETLCRFPAQILYGTNFRPYNQAIAEQKIVLQEKQIQKAPVSKVSVSKVKILDSSPAKKVKILENEPLRSAEDTWMDWALHPDYPLVLVVTEGVVSTAQNILEASLVGDLACSLRERLKVKDSLYEDDQAFWQDGLFIVSPHHVQIQAIMEQLYQRRAWSYAPLVDTVNKMQGQERECVVVSYGVSDIDYALEEGEFIYSRERLNVSLTRARKKAIVFLSLPLLSPPLMAFSRNDLLQGLDFMLQLRRFAEEKGETKEFPITNQTKLLISRTI